jgi:hypothetical protein
VSLGRSGQQNNWRQRNRVVRSLTRWVYDRRVHWCRSVRGWRASATRNRFPKDSVPNSTTYRCGNGYECSIVTSCMLPMMWKVSMRLNRE